jgi:hypothetical protein
MKKHVLTVLQYLNTRKHYSNPNIKPNSNLTRARTFIKCSAFFDSWFHVPHSTFSSRWTFLTLFQAFAKVRSLISSYFFISDFDLHHCLYGFEKGTSQFRVLLRLFFSFSRSLTAGPLGLWTLHLPFEWTRAQGH